MLKVGYLRRDKFRLSTRLGAPEIKNFNLASIALIFSNLCGSISLDSGLMKQGPAYKKRVDTLLLKSFFMSQ